MLTTSMLSGLCVSVNFVRNARVDLVVSKDNWPQVAAILKEHQYCVTDLDECKHGYEVRAV